MILQSALLKGLASPIVGKPLFPELDAREREVYSGKWIKVGKGLSAALAVSRVRHLPLAAAGRGPTDVNIGNSAALSLQESVSGVGFWEHSALEGRCV